MSNFTPEQIQEILDLYFENFAHHQYIGARYVPIFGRKGETSIEWDNSAPYEPLTIVLHEGNSYTSRQFVPTGVAITNADYWAETGSYNAQIEQYRQEVEGIYDIVNNIDDILPSEDFSEENTVKSYIDSSVANVDDNKEYLISVLGFTPANYNALNAYVAISDDGLCYNYVKKIPTSVGNIHVDPFLLEKDGIYYIIGSGGASAPSDVAYYTTEDFETYTYHQLNSGIKAYVQNNYGSSAGDSMWTQQLFKTNTDDYYLYSSAAIDTQMHYDAYNYDSREGLRRIFGVKVEIENGNITPVGNVQEVVVNDSGTQIDSYFDMTIVEYNDQFYFAVKDAVYNYIVMANGTSPLGPFDVYAKNIFKCIGTEAPIITPYHDGYIIYGQTYKYGSGENNFHINLAMFTSDFHYFEPFGFPRRSISRNCKTIRNLQAIPITGKKVKELFGAVPPLEYGSADIEYVSFIDIAKYVNGFDNCEIASFCAKQNFIEDHLNDDYTINISQFWHKFDATVITNNTANATKGSVTFTVEPSNNQGGSIKLTSLYNRSVRNVLATNASMNSEFLGYRSETEISIPFEVASGVTGYLVITTPLNRSSKGLSAILRFPSAAPDEFEVTVSDYRLTDYTLANSGGIFFGGNNGYTKKRTCRVTKTAADTLTVKSFESSGTGGSDILVTLL